MLSQVDPLGDTSIGPQASKAANVAPVRHGHRCVRRNAAAPDLDRWLCPIECAAQLVSSALRQPEFPERGATPRLLECGPVPPRPSPPSRIATCRLPSVDRHFDVATGSAGTAPLDLALPPPTARSVETHFVPRRAARRNANFGACATRRRLSKS